jgi:hypothetical protein
MNEVVDEAVAEVVEDVVEDIDDIEADEVDTEDAEAEAADSEETASDKDEPSESSTEKKDDGFDKRAAELTSKFYTEKQQKEFYKQQYEEAIAKQQSVPVEPGKTLADFEYDEAAYTSYLTEQAKQAAQAEVEQSHQQERVMKARAEFEMKEAAYAETAPDYMVVTRAQTLPVSPAMVETLQTAEKGPEVLYYLGKNPDVAASIAGMAPLDAARELGRIEATKLTKPEPPKSKTPPPPPKIKGADSAVVRIKSDSPDSDKLSDEEWLKRERKRLGM